MKKTAIFITILALSFALAQNQWVAASEVSGTISTDGGDPSNPIPSPTPTPTPVPTPTPPPDDSGGHSSEISGNLSNGTIAIASPSPSPSPSPSINLPNSSLNGQVVGGNNSSDTNNDATGTSSGSIFDEEAARAAMLAFGPRFGVGSRGGSASTLFTPGPPDAGTNMSILSVGREVSSTDDEELFNFPTSTALVARSGEGSVSPSDLLAASTLRAGSGLSLPQLAIIALIGLVVLASMGYAISRTGTGTV